MIKCKYSIDEECHIKDCKYVCCEYPILYHQGRSDAINDFKNALLSNDVVDKSVVKRVAEQI